MSFIKIKYFTNFMLDNYSEMKVRLPPLCSLFLQSILLAPCVQHRSRLLYLRQFHRLCLQDRANVIGFSWEARHLHRQINDLRDQRTVLWHCKGFLAALSLSDFFFFFTSIIEELNWYQRYFFGVVNGKIMKKKLLNWKQNNKTIHPK